MFDKILDNYGKVVESTLSLQQEMLQNWTRHWSQYGSEVFGPLLTGISTSASETPGAALLEQLSTARAKWAEAVTDMLKRYQETLNESYRGDPRDR